MPDRDRYSWIAPFYDLTSGEWPVYRAGRRAGVAALSLRPGDRVLDLGCGTGLSLPLLRAGVGVAGRVVGVDRSEQMLAQAARRVSGAGWRNVDLIRRDLRDLGHLGAPAAHGGDGGNGFDAVLLSYALSLVRPWQRAWQATLEVTRPGGLICVVDMARPTGRAALLSPLARAACALGGAAIDAHPWTAVETDLVDVRATSLRGGHLQVRTGVVPAGGYR